MMPSRPKPTARTSAPAAQSTPAPATPRAAPLSLNAPPTAQQLLQLQRTVGNRAVLRHFHLQSSAPVAAPVIQGVFKYHPPSGKKLSRWTDEDSRNLTEYKLYKTVKDDRGRPLFHWIVQIGKPGNRIAVRPLYPGSSHYREIGDDERKKLVKRGVRETPDVMDDSGDDVPPKKLKRKRSLDVIPAKRRKTMVELTPEESKKTLKKENGIRTGKLKSDLGVFVDLVPLEEGKPGTFMPDYEEGKPEPKPIFGEYRYSPDQVLIRSISLGNAERPPTQFENQERHTAAWTLARNGIMKLAGLPVVKVITHFQAALKALKQFVARSESRKEAESIYGMVANPQEKYLVLLKSGVIPITSWSDILARLIRLYLQAYQLSSAATFKLGKSEGSGEGHAMGRLRKDEESAANDEKIRRIGPISEDAETLIDVVSDTDVLEMQEFAFAIHHWLDLLQLNFPHLMSGYGDKVVAGLLNRKIHRKHKKELAGEDIIDIETNRDLLAHFGYKAGKKETRQGNTERNLVKKGGLSIPVLDMRGLTTDFTAYVGVVPLTGGTKVSRSFTFTFTKDTVTLPQDAYLAGQALVKLVYISDKDRPKTKFKKHQRSHTVAWTLVRHHLMSYAGKPVALLCGMLERNFTDLKKDVNDVKGLKIVNKALEYLKTNQGGVLTANEWETFLSTLMRWYAIAYQVAESTTFTHPTEKRPKGHGEAPAMVLLRQNEMILKNEKKWLDDPEIVAEKAARLFDGYLTPDLDEENLERAYHHWCQAMEESFPNIWKHGGEMLKKLMLKRAITLKRKPTRLGDIID